MNTKTENFGQSILFTPGPTPVPIEFHLAPLQGSFYHRSQDFYDIVLQCRKSLAPIFGSKNLPLILTSSGTGAMEAAVVNLTEENDAVVVIKVGKFGERFEKLTRRYGCEVHLLEKPFGLGCEPDELRLFLKDLSKKSQKKIKAIFFQANETSTGVFNPVNELTQVIHEVTPEALIVVDGISALVAHDVPMDTLGIDCLISGSQKGFGVPPGLSFIARSDRALSVINKRAKFYFDLATEEKGQKAGRTAWTPAIGVIQSLVPALQRIESIGRAQFIKHHQKLTHIVRSSCQAMGLELFVENHYSHALTSIKVPADIDGQKVLSDLLEKFNIILSGGQDELKGKIFRFSHLGFVSELHILQGLGALEIALHQQKSTQLNSLGYGVQKAVQLIKELK